MKLTVSGFALLAIAAAFWVYVLWGANLIG
jgi:predicted benzoate:H+ symporter BenE